MSNKHKGAAMIEFVVVGAFLAIVVLITVVEDGGVIDNLREYETRFVDAAAAP